MYFPFLYGKQNELFAIQELAGLIQNSKKVIPIIEPFNDNSTTKKVLNNIDSKGVKFILIVNPQNGSLVNETRNVFQALTANLHNVILAFYINNKTSIKDINSFINDFPNHDLSFIHRYNSSIKNNIITISSSKPRIKYQIFCDKYVSTGYKNSFKKFNRVILQDCFNGQKRNADYPSEDFFSDLYLNYKPNYYGFGDYQVIGEEISSGGPAHAVALHLTYLSDNDEIWVKHFISDDIEGTQNVQGKYFQALRKLINFLDNYNNTPETEGAREFRENLVSGVYHNLGYPKKLSIKHHIELINYLI